MNVNLLIPLGTLYREILEDLLLYLVIEFTQRSGNLFGNLIKFNLLL